MLTKNGHKRLFQCHLSIELQIEVRVASVRDGNVTVRVRMKLRSQVWNVMSETGVVLLGSCQVGMVVLQIYLFVTQQSYVEEISSSSSKGKIQREYSFPLVKWMLYFQKYKLQINIIFSQYIIFSQFATVSFLHQVQIKEPVLLSLLWGEGIVECGKNCFKQ